MYREKRNKQQDLAKRKLQRFAEMETLSNVFQPKMETVKADKIGTKGKWSSEIFERQAPLVVELGCGRGEYTYQLAKLFPDKNFVGIDIKGARIWYGAKKAMQESLSNVRFLRTRIEFISAFFGEEEIDEIWLTFPDPQLKRKSEGRRLTSRQFLEKYFLLMREGGLLHLKTDNTPLYAFTLQELNAFSGKLVAKTSNLYGAFWEQLGEEGKRVLAVKTYYEDKFSKLGHSIKYIQFRHTYEQVEKSK